MQTATDHPDLLRSLDWASVRRMLRTSHRTAVLHDALLAVLAETDRPFLADVPRDGLRTAGRPTRKRAGCDPTAAFWTDLRSMACTTREEEFVLARARDLLWEAILELCGPRPHAFVRAYLEEHLRPWSPVLAELRERPVADREPAPGEAFQRRLQQRTQELLKVQACLVAGSIHRVPANAGRYRKLGVGWDDLVQEGSTALLRAAERFDADQGVRFGHYANWWIQQGILKALSNQSRTVRLPVYLAQALHRVQEAEANAEEVLSVREVARRSRLKPDHVQRARDASLSCLSLDRTLLSDDGDESFAQQLADDRPAPEPEPVDPARLHEALEQQLELLPPREALVLRLRFGLEGQPPQTLDQVRTRLGVSRERVRQLQEQSLRRLAQPSVRKRLAAYV